MEHGEDSRLKICRLTSGTERESVQEEDGFLSFLGKSSAVVQVKTRTEQDVSKKQELNNYYCDTVNLVSIP